MGSTVDLAINGNITSSQISNVTISTNQSAATTIVSFTVTGQNGNTGFSNITIPINAVPYGTTPTIYVDGQPALYQGYAQDANNYYVWYTTNFSNHEILVLFAAMPSTGIALAWYQKSSYLFDSRYRNHFGTFCSCACFKKSKKRKRDSQESLTSLFES